MLIPLYWSEASVRGHRGGRQITIRRFGWSSEGQGQADAHALLRAEEGLQRALSGEEVTRRERKVPYNGADGLPIREEVLEVHLDGDLVVTRNSYGARCLNVNNVLIADVDFATPAKADFVAQFGMFVFGAMVGLFLVSAFQWGFAIALMASVGVGLICSSLVGSLIRSRRTAGNVTAKIKRRLDSFLDKHPEWSIRLYRTPAGLRLMVMHATFDPVADEGTIVSFFRSVQADPMYVRMCRLQRCFRARVSPKPWRIGIAERLRPRPGVWPVKPEWLPKRDAWIRSYETVSDGFASCHYLSSLGSGMVDLRVAMVQELHDRLARSDSDLPIA